MKLSGTAHTAQPWRIHELAHDFRLEDVWELPVRLGPDDFPALVDLFASMDPDALPFTPLYLTDDEWATEAANSTMHGVLHLSRVPDGDGGFRARMAVLVKPNGRLGDLYMAAIKPFRHRFVYPLMLRQIERAWNAPRSRPGVRAGR